MKILITGGKGYIARNLARLLSEKNHVVLNPGREELNILDILSLQAYLKKEKFDAILHCATKGGKRYVMDTFEQVYVPNIQMFENLMFVGSEEIPIILFGSGAEYDRRDDIQNCRENDIFFSWPLDPYGLSKNIITRRKRTNMRVLRLFGCFNYDEDDSRFIKNSINNIKRGLPIEIYQDKLMDYFFLDDIIPVIEYCFEHKTPYDINLVYNTKMDLIILASKIYEYAGISDYRINLSNIGHDKEYTGNGNTLASLHLPLIGLEEGLRRTVNTLL